MEKTVTAWVILYHFEQGASFVWSGRERAKAERLTDRPRQPFPTKRLTRQGRASGWERVKVLFHAPRLLYKMSQFNDLESSHPNFWQGITIFQQMAIQMLCVGWGGNHPPAPYSYATAGAAWFWRERVKLWSAKP